MPACASLDDIELTEPPTLRIGHDISRDTSRYRHLPLALEDSHTARCMAIRREQRCQTALWC
eukprot:1140840-Pelagomonas_calceolata.AAC.9